MNKLTLGSLFDGSGGFPLGGLLCGITPVWASEIEPFPIRVTTKRLPFMKHYGDVSRMDGGKIEPVDVITFGSPCQDMSIAGKRAGLDGSRSNLFYEAMRIVKEMRCATDGKYPRYIVWENVPGAFSSNKGADFQSVLEKICSVKGYEIHTPRPERWANAGEIVADDFSLAWRVFDAQYWGVPQRRKRIYLVADFAGGSAGKILFESEGVSGYTPQGFRSWQGTAGTFEEGAGASGCVCLNDQGGSRMNVTEDVAATLRAENHGHPPCVIGSAGFCTEHSAQARGIGYEEETSPTLRAGTVPATVYENHSQDTRYTGPLETAPTVNSAQARGIGYEEETSPTLRAGTVPATVYENHSQDTRYTGPLETAPTVNATYGMGGNNQPFVVETPKTLKIRSGCDGGGKGALLQENKSATLGCSNDQTVFVPKVYGICSKQSHSMLSDNPHSGFYEADTSRCLDRSGGNPTCNQGGMAVVALQGSMIGRADKNGPQGSGVNEDVSFTLDAADRHAVAYCMTTGNYTQTLKEQSLGRADKNGPQGSGVNEDVSFTLDAADRHAVAYCMTTGNYTQTLKEQSPTLMARDYKDPPVVNETEPEYIVRRLTPTECARLQGFPDWWCAGLGTDEPSEDEIEFWTEVFETHRLVVGTSSRPKSRNQIVKWLKDPHSDSAEYKMWGNGVALPNVYFVLSGIVYYAQLPEG